MLSVYIAARYERLVEMQGIAKILNQAGIVVTSRWLTGEQLKEIDEYLEGICRAEWEKAGLPPNEPYYQAWKKHRVHELNRSRAHWVGPRGADHWAKMDLEDIEKADVLLTFSESAKVGYYTGGRHVEFGYALACGKRIIVIGPMENIFYYMDWWHHARIEVYPYFDESIVKILKESDSD